MLVITTDLRTDGDTQPRGRLDDAAVQRYADDMEAGLWDFRKSSVPISAFHDGENYWLADGFHRVAAAKKARLDELDVDVRQGGQRDAILFSVGANATHGFPRSNEDKRRAVSRLLDDAEWSKWADREIARRCSVAPTFVGKLRSSLSTVDSEPTQRTYTTKHGTTATMDTGAIGSKPKRSTERVGEPVSDPPDGLVTISIDEWYQIADEAREAEKAAKASLGANTVGEPTVAPAHDPRRESITAEPVGELRTEPVGELRVDPSVPGQEAIDAEQEKELFVEAIRPLLDDLIIQGKKNMATACPPAVAYLAAKIEEVLIGWDFAKFGKRAKRCRLCGEKIQQGKIVMSGKGPAHWACQQKDEDFQRWLKEAIPAVEAEAAAAETEITLSGTAQQKLDAAMRAYRRKLELEFEARVQAECRKRAEELSIPAYFKRLDDMERMLTWPCYAVMTKAEYNAILLCLHPDGLNSRTEAQLAEAFRLFTHYKLKMVAPEGDDLKLRSDLPRTREELLARKKPRAKKSNGPAPASCA